MLSLSSQTSFEAHLDVPPNQDPSRSALFRGTKHQDPERLHRIEPRIFVRVKPRSRSLDRSRALGLAPSSLAASQPLLSKGGPTATCYPFASTSALRLHSRLAGEILLTDFCNQLSSTSTREPFDSRVEAFAFLKQRSLHRAVTAPPFGDSVSGGSRLDGALPTSAVSFTVLLTEEQAPKGRFAAALSTVCEAEDRPLTLPIAFRVGPGLPGGRQNTRTAATRSRQRTRLVRPGAPSLAKCLEIRFTLPPRPATVPSISPPRSRLPKCVHDPTLSR